MIRFFIMALLPFSVSLSAWAEGPNTDSKTSSYKEPYIQFDPYTITPPKATHEIKVRLFQHGLKNRENFIAEQLRYTETIFAQCPGLAVKITPIEYQALKSSTQQENMTEFKKDKIYYTKNFLKFVTPFSQNRPADVIDVHMTEYMDKEIRKTKKLNGPTTYGQAFNTTILNRIFLDPRPAHQQNPSLQDLAGNRVFLAINTVALQRNTFIKYPYAISKPRSYSLLAHELGHLIFENFVQQTGFYGDHWCPETNTFCEKGHLMSSGGNNDSYYTSLDGLKVIGFDPLPLLDTVQCEKLRTSRFVKRL